MSDALVSPEEEFSVGPRLKVLLSCTIILLLLPVAFYAIYLDNAIFAVGARVLLNGGNLYVDFLDMKPPVIYYLYTIPEFLFPGSAIALRFFDFLWQVALAFSIVYVVKKITGDEWAGFAAACIYSIAYTVLFHSATMQCESFAGLAFIWLFYLQWIERTVVSGILKGFLIGFSIGLKYTFGIVLLPLIIYDVFFKRIGFKRFVVHYFWIGCGVAISLSCIFYFMFLGYAQNYFDFLQYTSVYASFPPFNSSFFMSYFQKQIELFFYNYSFLFTALAVLGASLLFLKTYSPKYKELLYFAAITTFFLWISVVAERKFFTYHFSRLYVPLSILAGIGLVFFIPRISSFFENQRASFKIVGVLTAIFFLTTAPFFPWLLYLRTPYYYFYNKERYNEIFEKYADSELTLGQQQLKIAEFFSEFDDPGKIFVAGIEASRLAYVLKKYPFSKFATAQFYLGEGSRAEWKNEAFKEIRQSDWLVIQHNDRIPVVYGHNFSSWESMQRDSLMSQLITRDFHHDTTIASYHIFRKAARNSTEGP